MLSPETAKRLGDQPLGDHKFAIGPGRFDGHASPLAEGEGQLVASDARCYLYPRGETVRPSEGSADSASGRGRPHAGSDRLHIRSCVEHRPHREASNGAPDDHRAESWFLFLAQRQQGVAMEYFRRWRALWVGARVVWLSDEHSKGLFAFRRAVREQVQDVLRDAFPECVCSPTTLGPSRGWCSFSTDLLVAASCSSLQNPQFGRGKCFCFPFGPALRTPLD